MLLYEDITGQIINAGIEVSQALGAGYLESVYENAMMIALRERGLAVKRQVPLKVSFHGVVVGEFFADILVDDVVIVELKAVSYLTKEHVAQLINYLKATGIDVGLLMNFGKPHMEHRRCYRPIT